MSRLFITAQVLLFVAWSLFALSAAPVRADHALKKDTICSEDWQASDGSRSELSFVFMPKGCTTEGEIKKDCYVVRATQSKNSDWDLGEGVIFSGNSPSDVCLGAAGVGIEKTITLFHGDPEQGGAKLVCENNAPLAVEIVSPSGSAKRCLLPVSFPQ